jgi:hypothetical protein
MQHLDTAPPLDIEALEGDCFHTEQPHSQTQYYVQHT